MDKEQFKKIMTAKDFGYCKDCEEYFDLWKGNGHEGHKWRYAKKEELKGLIEDCITDGCYKER